MKSKSNCKISSDATSNSLKNDKKNDRDSTFKNFWKKIKILAPYIWPKKEPVLQLKILLYVILLSVGRAVNVIVPIYNKYIVDSLTPTPEKPKNELDFRWDWILIYVLLKFLQGGGAENMGILNTIRLYIWIAPRQFYLKELQVGLFAHLQSLSYRWHLNRKTGEVLKIIDRATDSINELVNNILVLILPTVIDIVIAVIYFATAFNIWFGLIVAFTMLLYIVCTIQITEWRTKFQRRMNRAENATQSVRLDALLNFETIKCFGTENYEINKFKEYIERFQTHQYHSWLSWSFLSLIQNFIINVGLLCGSMLCAYMIIYKNQLTSGDYVLFSTYIAQLYSPLHTFGDYYRKTQNKFIDVENMFDLLEQEKEEPNDSDAIPIQIQKGSIEVQNVNFSYGPDKHVLKDISFKVPAGKTIALVGPSGSGKSTLIKLLFRFYKVQSGAIFIDGQNINKVTKESLRAAIGVVAQDTQLFNNTIMYNIKYGRMNSFDEEVKEAAINADIHKRIMSFPMSYNTEVGERGLILSGGEKQRIAIARTLLKSPVIVLLDEATSSLDTQAERHIQEALNRVCANRTTIIVAHRLSTIVHADEILVLNDGRIVERGTHNQLLSIDGVYRNMWQTQLAINMFNNLYEECTKL